MPIPEEVALFAVFLTPFTPPDAPQVRYLPRVLNFDRTGIMVTTAAAMNTEAKLLGSEMRLEFSVYGYRAENAPGWMRLLYESLTDFSEMRSLLAIFKLATSVEIFCDRTFETYLEVKGIPKTVRSSLVRSGRSWSARYDRIAKIASEYLTPNDVEEFRDSKNAFDAAVRAFRDEFAHNDQANANHQDAKRSFHSSIPVFWTLDRLQENLTQKFTE